MEYLNRVELVGSIGCVRANQLYDAKVVNFSLSTTDLSEIEGRAGLCETTWHNVVAYDNHVGDIDWVKKGEKVRVVGRLRNVMCIAPNGVGQCYHEVLATSLERILE